METFKLGFVGAGFISRFQAKAVAQVRGVELAGVTAPAGAESLQALSLELGIGPCTVYKDVKELSKNVDAVCIFCPNFSRIEVMRAIAEAVKEGAELKGVIVEKPLGRTIAEARELVALAKQANLPTAYFENQIHMKTINAALQQLAPQQKAMGPLALARSAEEHAGPHSPWFWDPTQQGGGVLSDMGCHSIAVGWYVLNPVGKPVDFMQPISVNAETSLLKWGTPRGLKLLKERMGVDYTKSPAEDFATGVVTFQNPDTGQQAKAQFTNSWMYDKQGLRLMMDGLGQGYAFEINTLMSSLNIFIGDEAAEAVADGETALEKATSSRGLLAVEPNEPDLYGYVDEIKDAVASFRAGRDALLNFEYGLQITTLCQAAYLSAERGATVHLTDPETQKTLESYTSLIAQGRGREVLHVMS